MTVGLAKSPGGVDSSLVGVEDYLGCLLLCFAHKAFQNLQTVVIRFVAAGDRGRFVGNDLVVERVQKNRPLPVTAFVLEYGHIRNHDLKGLPGVPATSDDDFKLQAFRSGRLVGIFSGFADTRLC